MEEYTKEQKSIQASVYGLSTILNLEQLLTLKLNRYDSRQLQLPQNSSDARPH